MLRVTVRIEAVRLKVLVEIKDRIHSVEAEPGVALTVAAATREVIIMLNRLPGEGGSGDLIGLCAGRQLQTAINRTYR